MTRVMTRKKYDRAYFEREAAKLREECRQRKLERRKEQELADKYPGAHYLGTVGKWDLLFSECAPDEDGLLWLNYRAVRNPPPKAIRKRYVDASGNNQYCMMRSARAEYRLSCCAIDGITRFSTGADFLKMKAKMPQLWPSIVERLRRHAVRAGGAYA